MRLEKSCEIIQIEKQFPYFQRVCQPRMVPRGNRAQCAVQVGCDVVPGLAAGYGVSKDFSADLHDSVRNPCRFGLKGLGDSQQVLRFNARYGFSSQGGEQVFFQIEHKPAAVGGSIVCCLRLIPFKGDCPECIGFLGNAGRPKFLFVLAGVNILCQQLFCLVALFPCLFQGNKGILPETEELAFHVETVRHAPEFASGCGYIDKQPAAVRVLLGFVRRFQTSEKGIG